MKTIEPSTAQLTLGDFATPESETVEVELRHGREIQFRVRVPRSVLDWTDDTDSHNECPSFVSPRHDLVLWIDLPEDIRTSGGEDTFTVTSLDSSIVFLATDDARVLDHFVTRFMEDSEFRTNRRMAEQPIHTSAGSVKHKELKRLFDLVADPKDWKGPISAVVQLTEKEVKIVAAAIEYFTATTATVTEEGQSSRSFKHYHVCAPGYRLGPAGDH